MGHVVWLPWPGRLTFVRPPVGVGGGFANAGTESSDLLLPLGIPRSGPCSQLWVSKWVDYSTKYGLGYQLTTGNVGVLFNDKSSLLFMPGDQYDPLGLSGWAGARWHLLTALVGAHSFGGALGFLPTPQPRRAVQYVENTKSLNPPEVLNIPLANRLHPKKMSLLLYFRTYIEDSLNKVRPAASCGHICTGCGTRTPTAHHGLPSPHTYVQDGTRRPTTDLITAMTKGADGGAPRVTRWFRTKHAILFRLSHGVLQVSRAKQATSCPGAMLMAISPGACACWFRSPLQNSSTFSITAN